jgi:polyribonucleotide nucleotidyltransferase
VTAVASKKVREGIDFFPLTVDYQEKFYAAGRIPGGFFKREARPSSKATLTSRLIDRPLRPLFPEGFRNDVHIVATTLSVDGENEPDIWALVGASFALQVSDIPFLGPLAAVRIGRVDGKWVCNPSPALQKQSDVELLVAGTENAITMVEGGALEVPDEEVVEALMKAHEEMQPIIEFQKKMAKQFGQPKMEYTPLQLNEELKEKVRELSIPKFKTILHLSEKKERGDRTSELQKEVLLAVTSDVSEEEKEKVKREASEIFEEETARYARKYTLQEKKRIDQRVYDEIRTIRAEAGALPRVHGSALFTRGETQALVVVTLGTGEDEQRIDSIDGESTQSFMLHYNFPPFSVGEVGAMRGPGRREIGHGALAERALKNVLPPAEQFPYTIRIVSEILESNGSSSMASVCGGTLALMDAGVPIKAPVAGIAMGLIKEGDQVAILSDILGDEDGFGDMDFKVAGTSKGVTALQMDIKITGVTKEILERALAQAKEGRLYILEKMEQAISEARKELSPYAPRIHKMMVPKDKIRDVIGTGGKTIRGIIEQTGAKIDIDDSGEVNIASNDAEALEKAIKMVKDLTTDPEIGQVYSGVVKRIVDFGAFVEILPNRDGLLHISEINHRRIENISEVLQEGDSIEVKVLEVDRQGKIRLSRKALLEPPQGEEHRPSSSPREHRPHPRSERGYGGGHGERRDARKPSGYGHKDHKGKRHS